MASPRSSSLAAVVLACLTATALVGCEKSVDQSATPAPVSAEVLPPAVGSTVPGLPALTSPVFGPDFAVTIADANLLDKAEAQLAPQKSSNGQVKAFAAGLVDAHDKLATSLQAAITATGQRIFAPDSLSDLGQTKVLLLSRQTGGAFDKAYLADAVASQTVFLSAVRDYARFGDTPALKKFAGAAVAGAEQRLQAAKTLQASLK